MTCQFLKVVRKSHTLFVCVWIRQTCEPTNKAAEDTIFYVKDYRVEYHEISWKAREYDTLLLESQYEFVSSPKAYVLCCK